MAVLHLEAQTHFSQSMTPKAIFFGHELLEGMVTTQTGTNQVSGNGSYVAVAGYTNQAIDGQSEASGGSSRYLALLGKSYGPELEQKV